MKNYWQNRQIQLRDDLLKVEEAAIIAELRRIYKKRAEEIIKELERYYGKLLLVKSTNNLYMYNSYYKMLGEINDYLNKLGYKEETILKDYLIDTYEQTSKLVVGEVGRKLDTSADKYNVLAAWTEDGKNWSDRIWKNKAQLAEKVREHLVASMSTGESYDKFIKDLKDTFGVGYREAKRLAVTELAHARNQACLDKYKEAGINKVRIISEPDCCNHCSDINSQEYDLDNVPTLPFHPNCRCAYLAVIK